MTGEEMEAKIHLQNSELYQCAQEIEQLRVRLAGCREALGWVRDCYIGVIHDADSDRKAIKKINVALEI